MIFDNTKNIKELAKTVDLHIPKGNQQPKAKIGDTLKSSKTGVYKENTEFIVKDIYKQHGYTYYVDQNDRTHREKDIKFPS